jgi:hypothetical protein
MHINFKPTPKDISTPSDNDNSPLPRLHRQLRSKKPSTVDAEIETEQTVLGVTDGANLEEQKQPRRLLTAAVVSGLLLALGAISWFMLFVANANVGD